MSMTLSQTINDILSLLVNLDHHGISRSLSRQGSTSILRTGGSSLVEINEHSISLLGNDFAAGMVPVNGNDTEASPEIDRIRVFFRQIRDRIVRLNHLGISYSCASIADELNTFRKLLLGTNFKLYEEPANLPGQRWFFVGNLNNWEDPLFELVLTESEKGLHTEWIPHFQIDLDTTLTIQELETMTTEYLHEDFIDWQLYIPDYGVVLAMGRLANVCNRAIYLGLGTDLRNTKMHREKILRIA